MTRLADPQILRGAPGAEPRRQRVSEELRNDEGSALPLIVGLFVLAAGFVVVAAAATALHLERLRLLTVADGAALAGAESFRVADVEVRGDEVVPVLTAGRVAAAVRAYAADAAPEGLDALQVLEAGTADGRTARVRIAATWHPPILSALLPVAVPVAVESTATARFR